VLSGTRSEIRLEALDQGVNLVLSLRSRAVLLDVVIFFGTGIAIPARIPVYPAHEQNGYG
jgi:hypothetical protein